MRVFLSLFLLFWGGVTLVADGFTAVGLMRAARSGGWAAAEGTVTKSELKYGRKGSVSLDLEYTFTVNGVTHNGTEYEPAPHFLPAKKWPAVRDSLPVGTKVTVSYNPADPTDTTLRPGLKPDTPALLLLLTPFNVVALGLLSFWWAAMTGRRRFDPARHVRTLPGGVAVRLNGLTRLGGFGLGLLISSLLGGLVLVVGVHSVAGVPPSWGVGGAAWAAVLLLSTLAAVKWGRPRELVEGGDTLIVPNTSTGRLNTEVPRADVERVEVRQEFRHSKKRAHRVAVVVLVTTARSGGRRIHFAEYPDVRDARALADWLRERLGLCEGDDHHTK